MRQLIQPFAEACTDPYWRLADWKASHDRPVVGCFPMYVPEEIVHASGALPVTILGSEQPISAANDLLQTYVCAVVRSSLDLALTGQLDFLDAMIFPDVCDTVQCVADIWHLHFPQLRTFNFAMPGIVNSSATRAYLLEQLKELRRSMELLVGGPISDDSLRNSFAIYNENRAKLRALYELRRRKPHALTARQMLAVVVSSMLMLKEDHNRLLDALLPAVEQAPLDHGAGIPLVLAGSLCDEPEPTEMLDTIEELGGIVVDDDLFTGRKYFAGDVRVDDDPLGALADHFLDFAPCPTRHDPSKDWPGHIIELCHQTGAKGVVLLNLKYCEVLALDIPQASARLDAAGIPHFLIETDHEMGSLGQLRTRLQAFIEMLGEV